MLRSITPDEVRAIASLAREARAAQDRLLNKMRILDRFDDYKDLTAETTQTLDPLDATLDNQPLRQLRQRLEELGEEVRLELATLVLIGRGDYAADEWEAAYEEAQSRGDVNDSDSLALKPDLGDYLGKGLYLINSGRANLDAIKR